MKTLDASEAVLRDEGQPLHHRKIAELAAHRGYRVFGGPTPWATVASALYVDIQNKGDASRFVKLGDGVFALRDAGHPKDAHRS